MPSCWVFILSVKLRMCPSRYRHDPQAVGYLLVFNDCSVFRFSAQRNRHSLISSTKGAQSCRFNALNHVCGFFCRAPTTSACVWRSFKWAPLSCKASLPPTSSRCSCWHSRDHRSSKSTTSVRVVMLMLLLSNCLLSVTLFLSYWTPCTGLNPAKPSHTRAMRPAIMFRPSPPHTQITPHCFVFVSSS